MARRRPRHGPDPSPRPAPEAASTAGRGSGLFGEAEPAAARWGERLRRLALGLTTALVCARAYWPGEDAPEGNGLGWVLALLLVAGLGVASAWVGGTLRWRWSWADAAALAMVLLIGLSTRGAAERRDAINVAWQYGGVLTAYLLLRNLPRDRSEATAVAGAIVATAVALAAYGLFQIVVEDPELRAAYRRDPGRLLVMAGVPDEPVARKMFEQRLLDSREPRATFALANSLAGVLVGATVMGLGVLLACILCRGTVVGGATGVLWTRAGPALQAAPAMLLMLLVLLLTKSRSAYLGLVVGMAVVGGGLAFRVRARTLALAGATVLGILGLLVAAGLATRQLDREVLTEATKSLRYRAEYWQGTWALVRSSPRVFWSGVGPGNFGPEYLRHKLPVSSEEISDPHNMVLDVWAGSGLPAALSLVAALGLGLAATLWPRSERDETGSSPGMDKGLWLWGASSLIVAVALGGLDLLAADGMARGVVLALGWAVGGLLIARLWNGKWVAAVAAGAAALAVAVNLMAAGGIAMAPVALALWCPLAIGQTLREQRPCGRLRVVSDRIAPFVLAILLVAVLGTFLGAVVPQWRSAAALARAEAELGSPRPDIAGARLAYFEAIPRDRLSSRPWILLGELEFRAWASRGAEPARVAWEKVRTALDGAVTAPRNPRSLRVLRQRMGLDEELLAHPRVSDPELRREIGQDLARSTARAVDLYPTSAQLRGRLAEAAAAVGQPALAAEQAEEALRLDAMTPHLDKKLPAAQAARLRAQLPGWKAATVRTTSG